MPQHFTWKNLVGHRVLVSPNDHGGGPREYVLIEVAPDEDFLKFENSRSKSFWCPVGQYRLIHSLGVRK